MIFFLKKVVYKNYEYNFEHFLPLWKYVHSNNLILRGLYIIEKSQKFLAELYVELIYKQYT